MTRHRGGCHCGRVRFEVEAPPNIVADQCNCSICRMSGHLHVIVSSQDFTLVQGQDELLTYTFNTGVARHYFCRHCGIKSFYVPRSHPRGVSVNANCLDGDSVESLSTVPFDGQNWKKNVHKLSPIND